MVNKQQDTDEDTTQQLQSSSDETNSNNLDFKSVSTANPQDYLDKQQTDLHVAKPFINDCIQEESRVQNDWLQTNRKDKVRKVCK